MSSKSGLSNDTLIRLRELDRIRRFKPSALEKDVHEMTPDELQGLQYYQSWLEQNPNSFPPIKHPSLKNIWDRKQEEIRMNNRFKRKDAVRRALSDEQGRMPPTKEQLEIFERGPYAAAKNISNTQLPADVPNRVDPPMKLSGMPGQNTPPSNPSLLQTGTAAPVTRSMPPLMSGNVMRSRRNPQAQSRSLNQAQRLMMQRMDQEAAAKAAQMKSVEDAQIEGMMNRPVIPQTGRNYFSGRPDPGANFPMNTQVGPEVNSVKGPGMGMAPNTMGSYFTDVNSYNPDSAQQLRSNLTPDVQKVVDQKSQYMATVDAMASNAKSNALGDAAKTSNDVDIWSSYSKQGWKSGLTPMESYGVNLAASMIPTHDQQRVFDGGGSLGGIAKGGATGYAMGGPYGAVIGAGLGLLGGFDTTSPPLKNEVTYYRGSGIPFPQTSSSSYYQSLLG